MNWERFYRNVYYFAKRQDKTIKELEKIIGVSTSSISRMKGKKTKLRLETAYKIAKELDVSLETLIESDCRKEYLKDEIERMQKELETLEDEDF